MSDVRYDYKIYSSRKRSRVISYSLFVLGGFSGLFFPSETITARTSEEFSQLWGLLLFASALAALYGALVENIVWERVSLPTLAASFVILGIALGSSLTSQTLNLLSFTCIALGMGALLHSRYEEIGYLVKVFKNQNKPKK